MTEAQTPVSLESCRAYIEERVFPLRPVDKAQGNAEWPGMVGLELEMLPLRKSLPPEGIPEMVPLFGSNSLGTCLESLKPQQTAWQFRYADPTSSHILSIQMEDSDQLSFEPGGQFEISTRPYACLLDASKRLRDVQALLDRALDAHGLQLFQIGMNPWKTVDEIGLQMDKPRYQAMDGYYRSVVPAGIRMMRQTCTVQVNLDYGPSEEVMAKRFLVSNLIAPVATAIFANSPIVDGQLTSVLSNRALTWQRMDKTQTGFPELEGVVRSMDRQSCIQAYSDWILNGHLVFIEPLGFKVMDGHLTLKDWIEQGYQGLRPKLKDFETHLSLMFPEVRARGFLELRSVDCQHRAWQDVPAAFYTGILYDEKTLNRTLDLMLAQRTKLRDFWHKSVQGLQDPELCSLAQTIVGLSHEGFERLPSCFQGEGSLRKYERFLNRYTRQCTSPANELLAIAATNGRLTLEGVKGLEAQWQADI